jgi:hypothetical protein
MVEQERRANALTSHTGGCRPKSKILQRRLQDGGTEEVEIVGDCDHEACQ